MLLKLIDKLPPYDRFKATGLIRALRRFIDRLPITTTDSTHPLAQLVDGLQEILDREPHIERHECRVSQDFAWLLVPSIHAVERLVSARDGVAMQSKALAIMLNGPAAREWRGEHFDGYKDNMRELVPQWPELNDTLFWRTVRAERNRLESEGKRLDRVLQVEWHDRYWSFVTDSFARVLDWVNTRGLEDDRLVALSLALRLYAEAETPAEWLDQLHSAVAGDAVLVARLDEWLNPTLSEEGIKWQQRRLERDQKRQQELQRREKSTSEWIARLKANPDVIRNPPELEPGQFSNGQYWLYRKIVDSGLRTTRTEGANWQSLIDQFGKDVAHAYRDAAVAHWRHYNPALPSEGANTNSVEVSLHFAMAGLDIEAREVATFPAHLKESELRHALRYITWELNGFPAWLETMYRTHPKAVMKAIQTELFWELDNATPDQTTHKVLHDLAYFAPWLHSSLVPSLLAWLRAQDLRNLNLLRYSLNILKSGGVDPVELGLLAQAKVANQHTGDHRPLWYSIWVDAGPDTGVPAVSDWLAGLNPDKSKHAAQTFVTALMGNRHSDESGPHLGHFRSPKHLKSLYLLVHKYVRVNEDIDRAEGGAFTPELRDHAQHARYWLFQLLADMPGKATYTAIKHLMDEHPEKGYRPRMADCAYKRAEQDRVLEPWTAKQVYEFGSKLTRTPSTNRQLFDLTVDRLTDLKDWLERGDDSPYVTWKRAQSENEMRILISGWLNRHWGNPYTVAQEPELANSQRMDISLQSQKVKFPVPIELKLLDKRWTGPKLCERMRNQLAGDYMRDGTERCGLMLLVWKGSQSGRRWQISGKRVGVSGVGDALKNHWDNISCDFPNISALEVIVIDLTVRAIKSDK